ncbi:MAG: tetratricopeptide repeat-containing sensor histidine kinase [Ignavibacteriales bacterium]|nr:tetratricopeptide repeat-containing sensor histidine kinase [Ignavibacteriales bacterium]
MKIKLFLLLFEACVIVNSFAQTIIENKIDSLLNKIPTLVGTKKVDAITNLAECYSKVQPSEGMKWIDNGLEFSRKLNYKKGESDLLLELGTVQYNFHKYYNAYDNFQTAYVIKKSIADNNGIARSLNFLGMTDICLGDYEKAIEHNFEAVKVSESIGDKKNLATGYNFIGITNYILNDNQKAIKYMQNALRVSSQINDLEGIALSYEHLGFVFIRSHNFDRALSYNEKSLAIRKMLGDRFGIAAIYDNLGIINREKGSQNKALEYLQQSLKIKQELGDLKGVGNTYTDIGSVYLKLNNFKQALDYFFKSVETRKSYYDLRGIISSYQKISEAFEKKGDYKNALQYQKLFKAYSDSMVTEKNGGVIAEVQVKYETDKKEKELNILQKDSIIDKNWRIFLIIVIVLITSLAGVTFSAYFSKRKSLNVLKEKNKEINSQKEQLQLLNRELTNLNSDKDKLFGIIAHDLRSPFTSLIGLSQFLSEDYESLTSDEIKNYSFGINDSAKKVFELLENLLNWSRLNLGGIEFNPEIIEVNKIVEDVIGLFKSNAINKNLNLINEIKFEQKVFADKEMVHLIFRNLISNAIKYSCNDGKIIISSISKNKHKEFSVKDFGVGIGPEEMGKVFTSRLESSNGTAKEKGTGLGLLLCKEMVEKCSGEIWVKSDLESGSTFTFTLPSGN